MKLHIGYVALLVGVVVFVMFFVKPGKPKAIVIHLDDSGRVTSIENNTDMEFNFTGFALRPKGWR